MTSWSSYDGHMRVGIDVNFSAVGPSDTTVDATIDYWTENTYTFSDSQTLNYNDATTSGVDTYNYTNSSGTSPVKRKTTVHTFAISYSGGPTYTATAEITGAFDGSNPYKSYNYTLPARPASVPSGGTITASSVGVSTATGTLSGYSSNGDSIDSYEIQIATNSGFTTGLATYSGSSKAFTGLAAATSYWIRGRAHNGVGWSSYTSSKSFTTGATVPGAPTAVGNNTVTQSTANITWTAPGATGGSAITGYEIQRATDSGFTVNVFTATDPDDVSPYAAASMAPATTYWFRVRALNGVGAGAWSSATSLTTLTGTPSITSPAASEASLKGWPYSVVSATGIQPTSTITVEFSKDNTFTDVAVTTNLSTDLISTVSPHGLVAGDTVRFTALTTSAPLAINTTYYVLATGLTTTAFKVSATPGGTAIDLTQTGSGTMTRIVTLTSTPGSSDPSNNYTVQDTTKSLNNGTWYVRARVFTSAISYTTPNSATVTFTVNHTPAALLVSPATGSTAKWTASTNFTFNFSDPSVVDKMSAYQLVIEDNATGGATYTLDSGKVALAGTSYSQQFVRTAAISSGQKGQVLRWKVRVWDDDDQVSSYTGYSTITLVDPPLVTITAPTNGATVTTGTPVFTWTFTAPSGGTQASALVEVKDSTTNTVVWSKTVTGTALTATPPVVILQNAKSYVVNVTATDTYGLATTASNSFSASYSAPSSIQYDFDAEDADTYGYIDVEWSNATPDSLFASWKVYRRAASDTTNTWQLVYETTDQNVRHYLDYLLVAGDSYSYSVTQTATRSGSLLESTVGYYLDPSLNLTEETRYDAPDISHYWIVDTGNNQNSVRLENVTADDSTLEFETASFNIIGRGRHRDYGDELGYNGSLTCQVRGTDRTSLFRKKIETLRRNQETYYLRTPFGKLFPVALGDLGWTPLSGTGVSEMGEMTIPYEEVF